MTRNMLHENSVTTLNAWLVEKMCIFLENQLHHNMKPIRSHYHLLFFRQVNQKALSVILNGIVRTIEPRSSCLCVAYTCIPSGHAWCAPWPCIQNQNQSGGLSPQFVPGGWSSKLRCGSTNDRNWFCRTGRWVQSEWKREHNENQDEGETERCESVSRAWVWWMINCVDKMYGTGLSQDENINWFKAGRNGDSDQPISVECVEIVRKSVAQPSIWFNEIWK